MRLSRRHRNPGIAMDMTPMIDVTFQLIIFFMTASQLSELERERLELPKLKGTDEQVPALVTINVNSRGDIAIAGTTLTLEQMEAQVGKAVQERRNKPGGPDLIVLRVDRHVKNSATVNRIFEALKRQGISSTRIAVEVPGE